MRANRDDDENALGIADHPDAVVLLKLGVDAETEIRRISDLEFGLRLVEGAREEKAQDHEEIHAQRAQHRGHDEPAAPGDTSRFVRVLVGGKNSFECPRQ
jgi:hypothetical protein